MNEPDHIRVSDQERDVAATQLQVAFGEGRIDDTEFDHRMRAALTARTRGDLAGQVHGYAFRGAVEVSSRPPEH
jgi:hypothetical protein